MSTYFLRDSDYDKLITADSGTPLTDIFPNGIVFEMRGDDVISIRQPVCGDDPEMMRRIENGLKAMNAALAEELDERQPKDRTP